MDYLLLWWCGNSDLETSWSHWLNNLRQTLTIGNNSTERHVSLHCSSQSSLSLLGQIIDFMDDNDLECFLLLLIELLTSCNLFDEFLNNNLIVVVSFAWSHLNVVVGWKHNALNWCWSGGSRLKFFELTLDLVDCSCLIQLLEKTLSKGSLSTSRWTIEQDVR